MKCLPLFSAWSYLVLLVSSGDTTASPDPAQSTKVVQIEHTTILCNRTFEDARSALETSIPPVNTTYSTLLAAGDVAGALLALQSLPVLNTFIVPPRDFGKLLLALNRTEKAVQYEIGNPYTATRMNSLELGVSLYAPVRVLLREKGGAAAFEYDRPRSIMGQFGNEGVDEIAQELDRHLTALLMSAAGW